MEIRTWAEISIQQNKTFEPASLLRNQSAEDNAEAAQFFMQRMDFLRAWASEYKGSTVNAD